MSGETGEKCGQHPQSWPNSIDARSTVRSALDICYGSPARFLGMAAVVGSPSLILSLLGIFRQTSERLSPERGLLGLFSLALLVTAFILGVYMVGAIPVLTVYVLDERPLGWTDAFGWVQRRGIFWGIFSTILLASLAFSGGLVLFIVPGLVFGVWFMLAVPAKVLGGRSALGALSESKRLVKPVFTRGAARLAGALVLPYVLVLLPVQIVCSAVFGFMSGSPARVIPPAVISYLVHVFWAPVVGVSITLAYVELIGGKNRLSADIFL